MGIFTDGLVENIDIAGIAAEMRTSLYGWFNAHIKIVDPNTADPNVTPFDPATGEGGDFVPRTVWDSGARGALVQAIRGADLVAFGDQNTSIQGVRVQTKRVPSGLVLHSGLQVLVLDAGEDPNLARFIYAIKEGTDSSFAWGCIFDTTVVQSTILTPAGPSGSGYGNAYGKAYGS